MRVMRAMSLRRVRRRRASGPWDGDKADRDQRRAEDEEDEAEKE
jgi:hypothetical protein